MSYGDNLRKIWFLLSDTRSLKDVVDFFYRIYPHESLMFPQSEDSSRLLDIYQAYESVGDLELPCDANIGVEVADDDVEEREKLIAQILELEERKRMLLSRNDVYWNATKREWEWVVKSSNKRSRETKR